MCVCVALDPNNAMWNFYSILFQNLLPLFALFVYSVGWWAKHVVALIYACQLVLCLLSKSKQVVATVAWVILFVRDDQSRTLKNKVLNLF